jgi:nicotinate-nucleotide pyrophosphorylase (carboxylating)
MSSRSLLGRFDAPVPGHDVLDPAVMLALDEDSAFGDRSSRPLPNRDRPCSGRVVAREAGLLAGEPVFRRVFEVLADAAGSAESLSFSGRSDGQSFDAGDSVLTVAGTGAVLLAGERTALNFLQRLCGIATVTRRAVDAASGRVAVCDTRKTTPGLRALEKYAVVIGGGTSHRWSLGDMVMLKENHITLAGGIVPAIEAIRADPASSALPLTVEVRSFEEAKEAVERGVDRLLLDNMSPSEMKRIADFLGPPGSRPELEASGGVTPEDVGELADCGVDLVSIGSLTHSVRAIDLSFLLDHETGG